MRSNQPPVWTWLVRLCHWLVAGLVCVEWLNETGVLHRSLGYICVALVGLRVLNGFLTKYISSKLYWPSWWNIKQHIYALKRGEVTVYVGHNPLGQLAVYVMWMLIVLLGMTGWLSQTDAYWGEEWPVSLHTTFAYSLIGFVALHVSAVLVVSKLGQRNLIKEMLVGKNYGPNK